MSSSNPSGTPSRRSFLTLAATAGALAIGGLRSLPALAKGAGGGQSLPLVTADDPTAKALHYVDDASKVNKASSPTYKAGDKCSNCLFYQGAAGQAAGPCQLFPGKSVHANGWCSSHAPKA